MLRWSWGNGHASGHIRAFDQWSEGKTQKQTDWVQFSFFSDPIAVESDRQISHSMVLVHPVVMGTWWSGICYILTRLQEMRRTDECRKFKHTRVSSNTRGIITVQFTNMI